MNIMSLLCKAAEKIFDDSTIAHVSTFVKLKVTKEI
jgi:hypothetical protein